MYLLESPLVIGPVGALLGGILTILGGVMGVWLQARYSLKAEELKYKREVFRRFVGNRHKWTGEKQTPEEPYTSLNEIFVVFDDCPDVISAFNKFFQEAGRKDRFHDNSANLVRALADASGVDISKINDDMINRPIRLWEGRT